MFRKKIRMLLFLAITLIGSIAGIKNVSAATDGIRAGKYVDGPYHYNHVRGSSQFWEQSQFIVRTSDGAWVYCVQPFVKITGSTYQVTTEDLSAVANISYDNWKRIEKLAYYGYGYVENGYDHSAEKWYAATQMLIWQYADPSVQSFFSSASHSGRDDSILRAEMNEIEALVNAHTLAPRFDNAPSEMIIGNTITVNDSNGVVSNFNIENVNGGTVSKNGNSLNITANQVGTLSFDLTRSGNRYGEPVRLYYAVDSQNAMRRGNIDPIRTRFNINVLGGKVTVHKTDEDTYTNKPQGEATLEGAIYGVYKEDGTKVGTITTDAEGKVTSDYLPSLGKFYVLEEKASTGYQLDKNKYYFEITKDNLYPEIQVFEKVINRDYDFTKVYADDKTGVMKPEVGIEFAIYNNKGEEVKHLTTDEQGNFKFNLPYGTYTLKQLTSTKGHEKIEDMTIEVKEVGKVVKKTLANAEITAKLRVVKIDKDTKEVIKRANIKFKIFSVDKNEYVCQTVTYPERTTYCEFETDENGEFTTPYPLNSGTYKLEEVDQKIDGYLWNQTSHEFSIDENSKLRTDSEYGIIFDTDFENQRVYGEVKITKTGEVAVITENGFEFNSKSLEGVKFGLFASEDIIWNGNVVAKKDSKIAEKTTDKDGNIKFDKLYLGKYYIKEISTLDEYVLDENKYSFELKYKDQYTPVIVYSKAILNTLKTGKLEFTKTDFSEDKTLPDTLIEIYTENDELVFSGRTDSEGKIVIDRLPVGMKFYILEKEAPKGYKINTEKMYFEIKDNGEVVKATMKDEDITGTLEFTKVDFSTEQPLPNTLIEIYNAENDELVFSGRTDDKGMIVIDKIKFGRYYIIEKEAPEGYQINNEKMYFEITEDGQVVKSVMKDEIIEVPNTDKNETKELIVGGVILILLGAGAVIYANKKRKK